MPITVSYDLTNADTNQRNYIRSMMERFHWRRLGGSVLRYDGVDDGSGQLQEDWLNHVVPALMFMRSYTIRYGIVFKFFTLDAHSVAYVDHSDVGMPFGLQPQAGAQLAFAAPTNGQSSQQTIRDFIDASTSAT